MPDLEFKITGLKAARKMLDPKIMKKAGSRTINDMAKAIKTQIAKDIGQKYTIKAARIKKAINIVRRAKANILEAWIDFSGKTPTLVSFKHKYTASKRLKSGKRPSAFISTVKKGQSKKIDRAFIIPGRKPAFIRGRYSGGNFIPSKGPIITAKGPSIRGMFKSIKGAFIANTVLTRRMNKTFWRHYNFMINKAKARAR